MGQLTNNYPLNRAGLFFIWRHGGELKGTGLVNEHLRPALSLRPILKRRPPPHLLTPSVNSAPMVLLPMSRSSSSCLCLLRYQATSCKTKARQHFLRWVINCKRRHLAVAFEAERVGRGRGVTVKEEGPTEGTSPSKTLCQEDLTLESMFQ